MSHTATLDHRLTMSEKLSRLGSRLREPQWRKYGATLLFGKLLGLAVLFALIMIATSLYNAAPEALGTNTYAAEAAAPALPPDPYPTMRAGDIINPLNTVWTLVAAFLVFGMQAGFTMLEAGFCRSRETVNVLVEC